MSRPPRFDDAALAALGTGRATRRFDRQGRVALLGEAAQALLKGELPEGEARLFLAGALSAWLQGGGDLSRDYFKVIANGSHNTPARVWKSLQVPPLKGATDSESAATLETSTSKSEQRK